MTAMTSMTSMTSMTAMTSMTSMTALTALTELAAYVQMYFILRERENPYFAYSQNCEAAL
jgi:hypothetical protein